MFLHNISQNSLLPVISTTSSSLYAPLACSIFALHLWRIILPLRRRCSWSLLRATIPQKPPSQNRHSKKTHGSLGSCKAGVH
mmetsp:Transcript_6811/g.12475  ORF Transcript_6811/g.12475 Transcript_6811/m.12475 type:complete len:82 (-) Transcript_6811:228-473(-)